MADQNGNDSVSKLRKYAKPLLVVAFLLLWAIFQQFLNILLGQLQPQTFVWAFILLVVIGITIAIASVRFSSLTMKEHTKKLGSSMEEKIGQLESSVGNSVNQLGQNLRDELNREISSRFEKLSSEFEDLLLSVREISAERTSQKLLYDDLNKLADEGFIMNTSELIKLEKTMAQRRNCEIWVLTKFLEIERKEDMKEAIVGNLLNGNSYTYLIPDDRIKDFKERASHWVKMALERDSTLKENVVWNRITCIVVPDHFPYMTIVIYNAKSPKPEVVVKFPYREAEEDKGELYERWMFKVSEGEDAERIRDALKDLISSGTKKGKGACREAYCLRLEEIGAQP
jgi:hypothetical protein